MTLRQVRLVEEDVDLAVRVGPLAPSSLVARRLRAFPMMTLASPTLFEEPPAHPHDLDPTTCFTLHARRWEFARDGEAVTVDPRGRIRSTSGALLVQAAIGGAGVVQVPSYFCEDELRSGRLIQLLPEWSAGEMEFFLVYPEQRHLPARVRALIAFMVERVRRP